MRFSFLRNLVLCVGCICACNTPAWCQQSNPEKDTAGSQAGSSGKSPDQMGSQGTTESPLHKGDSDTGKKSKKDKKAKKPEQTKSSSSKS